MRRAFIVAGCAPTWRQSRSRREKRSGQNPEPRRVRQHGHVSYCEREQNQPDYDAVCRMPFRSDAYRQPGARKRAKAPTHRGQQQDFRRISGNVRPTRREVSGIRPRGKRMENGTHILHTDNKNRGCNETGDSGAHTSRNRAQCPTSISRLPYLTCCRFPRDPPREDLLIILGAILNHPHFVRAVISSHQDRAGAGRGHLTWEGD